MKRLLFLGNSHLVAVQAAWQAAQPKGYEAEFFGAPQRDWARMALLPGNLFGLTVDGATKRQREMTEKANGKPAVSLDHRDILVIVGSFPAADPLAILLADCDVTGLRETGAATLLSDTLFAKACQSLAEAQLPPSGWQNRDETVLMLPRPAPAETCLGSTFPGYRAWHRLAAAPGGVSAAFGRFDDRLKAVMAECNLVYIPQPARTRTAIGLTAGHLLAPGGGIKSGEDKKRGDHAHMNISYGAACIAELLTALQES